MTVSVPKVPVELPFSVPVAIPFRDSIAPVIAKTAEEAGKLLLEHGFDGRTDVSPATDPRSGQTRPHGPVAQSSQCR